ncbi:uncharacterized protein DS421_13g400990 [Arachis hypogaea]|nr:uncharacterized protein DS421_13g400990 [Arachis hypogaea]
MPLRRYEAEERVKQRRSHCCRVHRGGPAGGRTPWPHEAQPRFEAGLCHKVGYYFVPMVRSRCCESRGPRRTQVQEGYNFFRWADPETEVEHSEIARIRKKLSMMKSRTKAAEWKLKFVAVLGFFGWVGFVCLLLQSWSKATQQCLIPLNLV